jgi:hypothetical protein
MHSTALLLAIPTIAIGGMHLSIHCIKKTASSNIIVFPTTNQ